MALCHYILTENLNTLVISGLQYDHKYDKHQPMAVTTPKKGENQPNIQTRRKTATILISQNHHPPPPPSPSSAASDPENIPSTTVAVVDGILLCCSCSAAQLHRSAQAGGTAQRRNPSLAPQGLADLHL